MNLAMLTTLQAIITQGSFVAAAQKVGCTPSAVTLQVRQLEKFFGRPLFDRSSRIVRPTQLALEVAGVAKDYSERLAALRTHATFSVSGVLRLGAITSIQTDVFPHILKRSFDAHPALQLRISPLNDSEDLLDALKADRLDAVIVSRPDGGGTRRLQWADLARQDYVMIAPAATASLVPSALLADYGWIAYDTALPGGRKAAQYVRRCFPTARSRMEMRSTDAIVSMVALGLGVSILPRPRAPLLDAYGVQVVALGDEAPYRQIALAWREADAAHRSIAAVLNIARSAFNGSG
ncbi:LysR family transcriptional regulator [Verminephrobacter aporrectodeae]|uniref:LysR family transcriptional regulator n=1 Tax=Verminephrobacter aporrectodeae TaxID=1110389 RepID=UPI0002DE4FA3|nr:LysR family transcriptional regulator [Verminephrobacter aporrectodeae]